MSAFDTSLSLKGLFSGDHKKPTLILLLTPFLLMVFKYYGSKEFYREYLQSTIVLGGNPEWTATIFVFFSSVVLFGLVPLVIIRFIFRDPLSSYGLQLGDWSFGWKALLVLSPIFVVSAFPSSRMSDFVAEYPLYERAGETARTFLTHAFSYLFFYVAWEIYFRGFMQFGLRSSLGDWNAILVQVMASCLIHIGKPAGETFSSIIGGIVWGMLAFRTRSLVYGIVTHWILGISLDFFIVYF
ncbi:MAG: CPBP family intramembrane metalloprotease [Ignavibacteriales bacterium]|nr:CPBP family intramembrane metalloprotease [Ignavibacteriales bacterium]